MKKIVFMLVVVCMCVAMLASCSSDPNYSEDPYALTKLLDSDDRTITVAADDSVIEKAAKTYDVRANGIGCIITVSDSKDEDGNGIFFYCEDDADAEIMQKDLEKYLEDRIEEIEENIDELRDSDYYSDTMEDQYKKQLKEYESLIVERSNTLVYMGTEALWEEVPQKSGLF